MEHKFIDKMFEMGDLENMKSNDLKRFISKRGNEKLKELGYDGVFEWNDKKASNLDWFYHLTGGTTHTDFLKNKPEITLRQVKVKISTIFGKIKKLRYEK